MYTGSEGLSLQANFVILGLLRLEMLSFVTRFNISGFDDEDGKDSEYFLQTLH
jgi:hypothetical protein